MGVVVQLHLHETTVGTAELAAIMPNTGLDWGRMFGKSGAMMLSFTLDYAGHWESLLARWQTDDLALLQPTVACPCYFAQFILATTVFAAVGKREVELTGQSAGGNYAAGQTSVADRISAQTADAQT